MLSAGTTVELNSCAKCVKFSPDGSVVSIVSEEPIIRIGALNECGEFFAKCITLQLGGDVFDYQFYPGFDANVSSTCAVLVSSRRRPVQLISVCDGKILSAYPAYSPVDEIIHPLCVSFSPMCGSIVGGFARGLVNVWDVQRPGKQIFTKSTNLKGIVGALSFMAEDSVCVGTYSGSIGIVDIRSKIGTVSIGQHTRDMGGVVQLATTKDEGIVVSGHRMDKYIRVWDTRKSEIPVMELVRVVKTHQRFQFALCPNGKLFTGDHEGTLTGVEKNGDIFLQKEFSSKTPLVAVDVFENRIITAAGKREYTHSTPDISVVSLYTYDPHSM